MGNEIIAPSVLISMLMELRQHNRQLADELSAAQMLLRTLQATAASGSNPDQVAAIVESTERPEASPTAWQP